MPPVVDTKYGRLQGLTEDDLHVFRGVPFAAPPVGELRFRPSTGKRSGKPTRLDPVSAI